MRSLVVAVVLATTFASSSREAVEVLTATSSVPAHLAGQFADPIGFVQAATGEYLVLDRRSQTVFLIDAKQTTAKAVVQVGFEPGRVLKPAGLAISSDDIFAVGDTPDRVSRIQYFNLKGLWLGGFNLQGAPLASLRIVGGPVGSGTSLHFTGRTFLVSQPENGSLISEFDIQGRELRKIGLLRTTGYESDRALHLTLNRGLPLADPAGGFFFVFQNGVPAFRKYDAAGTLVYERHIEGPELDAAIQRLPTEWPARAAGVAPQMESIVRTAAIDPGGRLWIALAEPFTYVYAGGEKTRTVQFRGAEVLTPISLAFAKGDRVLVTPGCYEFNVK